MIRVQPAPISAKAILGREDQIYNIHAAKEA